MPRSIEAASANGTKSATVWRASSSSCTGRRSARRCSPRAPRPAAARPAAWHAPRRTAGSARRIAARRRCRRRQRLHLQAERGERRAQFVRRLGDEQPLPLQGVAQSLQQVVHRHRHGTHFVRKIRDRHRRRSSGCRARKASANDCTAHHASHDPGHEQDQRRHQYRERRNRAQRHLCGPLLAHVHRLRHLDDAAFRLDPEHAPATGGRLPGRQPERGQAGHHRMRPRQEDAHTIERPDLHNEVVLWDLAGQTSAGVETERSVAQQHGRLTQVVIEERVRLGQRVAVRRHAPPQPTSTTAATSQASRVLRSEVMPRIQTR